MCDGDHTRRKNQNKQRQQNQPQNQTPKKQHRRNGQIALCDSAAYVLTIKPCMHWSNTENDKRWFVLWGKRRVKSPLKNSRSVCQWRRSLMLLDSAILECQVAIMVDCQSLCNPYQPSHVHRGHNICMLDGSSQGHSYSAITVLSFFPLTSRRLPLKKPQPVCRMMAMRAVAPAAEEDAVMRSPPSQVVRKPCWTSWLCTAVRLHIL